MVRRCARPDCSDAAVATLGYDYGGRTVWIDHLTDEDDPATHDLCGRHAERFVAPHGWELSDRRTPVEPLFRRAAS